MQKTLRRQERQLHTTQQNFCYIEGARPRRESLRKCNHLAHRSPKSWRTGGAERPADGPNWSEKACGVEKTEKYKTICHTRPQSIKRFRDGWPALVGKHQHKASVERAGIGQTTHAPSSLYVPFIWPDFSIMAEFFLMKKHCSYRSLLSSAEMPSRMSQAVLFLISLG